MREWTQIIWISVSLIVASIILGIALVMANSAEQVGKVQQSEIDAIALAKEYREVFRYDEKELRTQDIVSAVMEFRGNPVVEVYIGIGAGKKLLVKYDKDIPREDYTSLNVNTELEDYRDLKFISHVVEDENGEISTIIMEEVT